MAPGRIKWRTNTSRFE